MNTEIRIGNARKELKASCAAFHCMYCIEHIKHDGCTELHRHDIYQLCEGGFEVVKSSSLISSFNARISKATVGRYTHLHLAKAACEGSVTLLEQDGADFVEEHSMEILNVMDEEQKIPTLLIDIPVGKEAEYLGNDVVYAQKITVGFRLFVAIDPYGKVWVKTNCSDVCKWEEASSAIRNGFSCMTSIEGGRGCVFEIVLNGAAINIIDVWFLHDQWLDQMDMTKRHNLFKEYCKVHNLSLSILFGSRARTTGVSVLAVDTVKALVVEKNGLRYLVKRNDWQMMIGNGWKKQLYVVDMNSMGTIGTIQGNYLPDISYKSFRAAGQGTDSFWY